MAEVVWTDEASEQLDQIIAYVEQFDPAAALRTGEALYALGNSLSDFPRRGRLTAEGFREMVRVRPYILKYQIKGDRVIIRSIRHSARDLR